MGLSIAVIRPIPIGDRKIEDLEDFYVLEECPELKIFERFAFERENGYFDLEETAKQRGYDFESLQWKLTHYDNEKKWMVYEFVDKDENRVVLENPIEFSKKEMCIIGEEVGCQRKGANKNFYSDDMWDSPCVVDLKTLEEHWNKYFSGDGNIAKEGEVAIENGAVIMERGVPFGYGVEYDLPANENRENFKRNIIDKFIEGETFVSYC